MKVESNNEDKIKVLEKAIEYLRDTDNNVGICDSLCNAVYQLGMDSVFSTPKFYGITLPPRSYAFLDCYAFSFPLTETGKIQRIDFLYDAINRLKNNTMNKQEREAFIDKVIKSQHKGAGAIDYLVYTDRFNALNKLSDEELLKQNPELN